jgi:hypothetical protein
VFDAGDEATAGAVARKQTDDERQVAALVAGGTPAVRLVYEDGCQHRSFRETMIAAGGGLGEVSRPEALGAGPREVAMPAPGPVAVAGKREPVRGAVALKPAGPSRTEAERQRLLKIFAAEGPGQEWRSCVRPSAGAEPVAVDASSVSFLAAFAAGTVSFLSPCMLPLVPGYVSYVAGQSAVGERDSLRTLGLSLCFVLGFTTVFVAFGAGPSALGFALLAHRQALNLASGLLVILFGQFTAGLLRPAWLQRELRWHGDPLGRGPVAAYLLGTAFAFG